MGRTRPALAIALVASTVWGLGGCGGADPADDGVVTVVASTNVYGDIASQIAGEDAEVTSIITSSSQDPHEYEASAQDRLALDEADVVVENGAGYDPFVDTLLDGASSDPVVINAAETSGLLPSGADPSSEEEIEGFNEHVWYDFAAVDKIGRQLADELADVDPDNAAAYQRNYESFAGKIKSLESAATELEPAADGQGVAITEPVPLYLLEAVGLENQTPEEFSEAVEEGTDVPPRALDETLDLVESGTVVLLAYNSQAADSTTEQVREAAEGDDVPVVDFTETLPDQMSYEQWQQGNLDAVAAALEQSR